MANNTFRHGKPVRNAVLLLGTAMLLILGGVPTGFDGFGVKAASAQGHGGSGSSGGGNSDSGGGGGNSDSGGGGGNSGSGGGNSDSGSGGGNSDSGGSRESGGGSDNGQRVGGSDDGRVGTGGQSDAGGPSDSGGQGGRPAGGPSAEADEDSDRPDWAGGNPELNPHAGAGTGNPTSGTAMGDIYGDLVVLLRDPATGAPIVAGTSVDPETGEVVTEYWICIDPDCIDYADIDPSEIPEGIIVSTVFGEIPEGVAAIEVDFGRSSVARAPDSVTDHALEEALDKLEVADEVALDVSGRIVYSIDGTWYTIDSPLENLALYIDLVKGLASSATTDTEAALDAFGLATLDMATSLLAGVADKTGEITLDYLVNENVIAGVVDPGEYYDYSTFEYTRDYPTEYTYWVSIDGALPVTATLDINAYLADESVNGELPGAEDHAALFAAASDDALEVIELVHTQIHTEILPGTIQ